METREFALKAIKNGFTNNQCEGWDWIKANIAELDFIFQTAEYKAQNGMQYRCMPLIVKKDTFAPVEQSALEVAWYINNGRENQRRKEEYATKMTANGYIKLDEEIVK